MTRSAAFLSLALLALPLSAHAAESTASVTKRATVTLVSDTDAVAPGTAYRLGLRFQIADGWHIYSRNPGDAGLPPDLAWTLPAGTTVGDIAWPTPRRLPEGPLMTFGYTKSAMLTLPATGPGPIQLHASWLICNNICVPEEADFNLDLPAGTPASSAEALLFDIAAQTQPRPSPFQARIAPDGTLVVGGAGLKAESVSEAWFIPHLPDLVTPTGKQILDRTADEISLRLPPGEAFRADQPLAGVLVLRDGSGQETALAVTATPGAAAASSSLWRTLGFALLGGLILNLMPCVFPVLAMKAMAIARLSAEARSTARAHAAGYTLGVMLSFAAIGGLVLGLRQAGHAVGWGFQFQSPVFVTAACWVLFAVGLNLSGLFEVGGRLTGSGQGLTLRNGFAGSFFSGVLAVLVATPCTAPFMGVALAAALTAPPVQTMALFLALGLGLALPAALLSVVPGVARLLPRPGKWMDVFKQALAFPMYAASAWLIWVISLQAGPDGVLAAATGLVLVAFAGWTWRVGRNWGAGLALLSIVAAGLVLAAAPVAAPSASAEPQAGERFTMARLGELRAEGKPVFVNMTAAWCVTCLVNERVALATTDVRQAMRQSQVTLLTGDWTRPNPEITTFLRSQGRDGVPLYLFFPPSNRPPVMLSQILTQQSVLDLLATYPYPPR